MKYILLIYFFLNCSINFINAGKFYNQAFSIEISNGKNLDSSNDSIANETRITLILCKGQSIKLDAGDGTNFSWSPPTWLSGSNIQSPIATPDSNVTYYISYTDINSIQQLDSISIEVFLPPTVNLLDTAICPEDTILLDAGTSGDIYNWSNGENTQYISVNQGYYAVTVTNVDGCSNSSSCFISHKPKPNVQLTEQGICPGDSTILDAGNFGATYIWSNGNTIQTNIVSIPDTYFVTVISADGCKNADSVLVIQKPKPSVILPLDTNICTGQTVTLNAGNPGCFYQWSNGVIIQLTTVNTSGYYSVTVTNSDGCIDTSSINVYVYQPPQIILPDLSICPNDSVFLDTGNQGNSYIWSTGSTNPQIWAKEGSYSVTVTYLYGCSNSDTCNITLKPKPEISISNIFLCSGETATIGVGNQDLTYLWNTGQITDSIVVNSSTATYYITATNSNGCTDTASVKVFQKPKPIINLLIDTNVCSGSVVILNAGNPGSFYQWSSGEAIQIINAISGLYSVTVTNAFGCSDSTSSFINVYNTIRANLNNQVICIGESTQLNPNVNNVTYTWSTGENSQLINVTPTVTQFYSITITDSNGCVDRDTCLVIVKLKPDAQPQTNTICSGDNIVLNSGTIADNYNWSTGETTQFINVNPTSSTSYIVTVINTVNCYDTATISVIVNEKPQILLSDKQICPRESTTLDAGNDGIEYIWSNGENTSTVTVSEQGSYSVSVTNLLQCKSSDTCTVSLKNQPEIFINDVSTCIDIIVNLNAGNVGSTYNWSTGENTESINVTSTGVYSVTVTNSENCKNNKSVNVFMNECPDKYNVGVPNAFSPNGDGLNDVLYVDGYGVDNIDLFIYNRVGQLIFHSKDIKSGWDGTFRGLKQNVESYSYYIKATFKDGKTVFKKGNITLLK